MELMLNAFVSLHRVAACDDYRIICQDEATKRHLAAVGFHTLHDQNVIDQTTHVLKSNATCSSYLITAMMLRAYYTAEFVRHGYDVLDMDVDMVPLKNPFDLAPRAGMLMCATEYARPPDNIWLYEHTATRDASITLMAGLVLITGSSADAAAFFDDCYQHYVLPNVCETGFYQTEFNRCIYEHNITFVPTPENRDQAVAQWRDIEFRFFFPTKLSKTQTKSSRTIVLDDDWPGSWPIGSSNCACCRLESQPARTCQLPKAAQCVDFAK